MTASPEEPLPVNPLAHAIREAAARQTDPQEAESLLRSAEKVEAAHRKFHEEVRELEVSVERGRAEVEAIRTRDHLPRGFVIAVLMVLAGFLVYVALKHHV